MVQAIVKRLFLYLAEKIDHSWFKYLDIDKIELGHGKRSYVDQGRYIAKYKITVPKEIALHGGTAINLFFKDMPRLSVDLDLTYIPIENRADSITHINASLSKLRQTIGVNFPTFQINHRKKALKLLVNNGRATVKIEVNAIKRGCYASPVYRPLCQRAQHEFKTFAEIQLVDKGHLYGGKIQMF